MAVNTGHGLCANHGVGNGFFRGFDSSLEQGLIRSFETVSTELGPGSLPAPRLAVEKAMKISPEEFPELEPVRARPIVARRASRFSCPGKSGASVATTIMMDPTSPLTSGSNIALAGAAGMSLPTGTPAMVS
jgi:hypothetical protein